VIFITNCSSSVFGPFGQKVTTQIDDLPGSTSSSFGDGSYTPLFEVSHLNFAFALPLFVIQNYS